MTDTTWLSKNCDGMEMCVYSSWDDLIVEISDNSEVVVEYVLDIADAVKLRDYLTVRTKNED